MVTRGVLALISVVWLGFGEALLVAPAWCQNWIEHSLYEPTHGFLISQGAILLGLFLLLGTATHPGFWLWATMGTIGVVKGLFLLGGSDLNRGRMLEWLGKTPTWALRASGAMFVLLAAVLTVELVLGFS